ncbi:hypothetical protein WN943_012113 [Citrus x changshan-huyou]
MSFKPFSAFPSNLSCYFYSAKLFIFVCIASSNSKPSLQLNFNTKAIPMLKNKKATFILLTICQVIFGALDSAFRAQQVVSEPTVRTWGDTESSVNKGDKSLRILVFNWDRVPVQFPGNFPGAFIHAKLTS